METSLEAGTPVEKTNSRPDDAYQDGSSGRVVQALGPTPQGAYGYMVRFDARPDVPVFVAGSRLRIRTAMHATP